MSVWLLLQTEIVLSYHLLSEDLCLVQIHKKPQDRWEGRKWGNFVHCRETKHQL